MQKREKNQQIIKKVQDKIYTRGLYGKLAMFPVENVFTRRPRFWRDKNTGKAFFKVHMWDINTLEGAKLEEAIESLILDAVAHFGL